MFRNLLYLIDSSNVKFRLLLDFLYGLLRISPNSAKSFAGHEFISSQVSNFL